MVWRFFFQRTAIAGIGEFSHDVNIGRADKGVYSFFLRFPDGLIGSFYIQFFGPASPAMTRLTSPAILFTASNWAGEETGNPASITSTLSFSSCRAISSFS